MKHITLFTHTFKRLWDVTPPHKRSHIKFVVTRLIHLERAVKKDDPYADWAMLNIERAIFSLNEVTLTVMKRVQPEEALQELAQWLDVEPLIHLPEKETPRMAWLMLNSFQKADRALLFAIGDLNMADISRTEFEQIKSQIVKAFHECIHVFHTHRTHVSGITRQQYSDKQGHT
ncbi:AcaB family transcriptional regulator, partial [Vibrio lentus]